MSKPSNPPAAIKPSDYSHSPVHYAIATGNHMTLSRLVNSLPKLTDPSQIHTESDSLSQENISDQISAVLDRRDVPYRETPLHLAVRLNDAFAARVLAGAGADISLQNSAGWNALQEALCSRSSEISLILLRHHHRAAWAKWRRRLPRLVAVLRRMRDFYMEISFHFESSVIPFVGKMAPSDTYKIWKRDGNLRADTTLSGFDGFKMQRADQSILFLGDGDRDHDVAAGSLLVLNHDHRKVLDAFENAGAPMSESDIAGFCSQTSIHRPGVDVTKAELVGKSNWRRQDKTENVGEWKARVYEIHNVFFSFRSRKVAGTESDGSGSEQVLPLELDEDDDGFLVADNPSFTIPPDRRRHSSFIQEEKEWVTVGRKSVDYIPSAPDRRRLPPSVDYLPSAPDRRRLPPPLLAPPPQAKEKEYLKSLRPSVWLTEQFPIKTEELLPLLDILANKVKAVRRMRELLTTKFPPGTFPVKIAIPVVPTVRVLITFTKFVELQPIEQFYTPLSSPRHLHSGGGKGSNSDEEQISDSTHYTSFSSSSSSSSSGGWLRRSNSRVTGQGISKHNQQQQKQQHTSSSSSSGAELLEPFAIPKDYTWMSADEKNSKMKKSKSVRKSK